MKSIDQTYDGTVFSETYYPTVYSDSALKIYAFANAEKYLKLEHQKLLIFLIIFLDSEMVLELLKLREVI